MGPFTALLRKIHRIPTIHFQVPKNYFREGILSQSTIHVGKYTICPMDGMLNDTLFFGSKFRTGELSNEK